LNVVWDNVREGLRRGVSFLNDEGIFNESLLPTEVILYLTSALWAGVPRDRVDQEGQARKLIRKTIWRASFTDRYGKTATTRAFNDYRDILKLIKNPNANVTPDLFDKKQNPLPSVGELIYSGWPSKRDRLGRAIIAVSLRGGGYDFADGGPVTADNVRSREFHHIYPRNFLQQQKKFSEHEIDSALNCALISWRTNRTVSDQAPDEYIKERARQVDVTEQEVQERLESHLIPYGDLIRNKFRKFLRKRAKLIRSSMRTLCKGHLP